MTAHPDRQGPRDTAADPRQASAQSGPAPLVRLSDAQPHRTPRLKRHEARSGGSPVVSILTAPSIRDQPPVEHRGTARAVLGGLIAAARSADIHPADLWRFERGAPLRPDEFDRLDRLVCAYQSMRNFGR